MAETAPTHAPAAAPGLLRICIECASLATVGNPVLVKEFRTRMRGARAYWMLLIYTLFLAGILAIMYFVNEVSRANAGPDYSASLDASASLSGLGRSMYYFVFISQAILVALITPALTSGTITIEREQRCYELLATTPLRPADLVRGKLAAAVSFVVLLLTASLPLASLSFLVGGVSPQEIGFSYLLLALSAFSYGALGIFWSATLRGTAASTVVTYLTVLTLFIATLIPGISAASAAAWGGGGGAMDIPFQSLNPLSAVLRGVEREFLFHLTWPSWIPGAILNLLAGLLGAAAAMHRLEHFPTPRPFWIRLWSSGVWMAFALALFGPILGGMARAWRTPADVDGSLLALFTTGLPLLALLTPVYCTGDVVVRRGENPLAAYLGGFLPHRLFRAEMSSGLPLIIAWTLAWLALGPIAVAATEKGGIFDALRFWVPGSVLMLSVILGLAGASHALSVLLPSRWAACLLVYLIAALLMLAPHLPLAYWNPAEPDSPIVGVLCQSLYLAPTEGLRELAFPKEFWRPHPPMAFGPGGRIWIVTSAIYLLMGAAGFAIAATRIRRFAKRLNAPRLEAEK